MNSKVRRTTLSEEDLKKQLNEMESTTNMTDSFTTDMFSGGLVSTVDEETLQEWFNNYEDFQEEIEGLMTYYYISNPAIFQAFDLPRVLPDLDYKITTIEKGTGHAENSVALKKSLKRIRHKQLTRDIMSQVMVAGTLCGIWLKDGDEAYLHVFDDLSKVFPIERGANGQFAVYVDMMWIDEINENQRENLFELLSPHLTESDYSSYLDNSDDNRYKQLPPERTVCVRTHTLFRNQRFGVSWNTQAMFDTLHKDKLKNLEKSISNKAINSVGVLSIGESEKDSDLYHFNALGNKNRRSIYNGVKTGLEKNSSDGVTVIGIPHWAKLDFPEVKVDGLDPDKFSTINKDLNASTNGIMNLVNGESNFSAGKLTLDIMYKKIAELLEIIEDEVYQKLFNLVLGTTEEYNYSLEYDKTVPLTKNETVAILEKLNSNFGFSLKELLDNVGIDFEKYIENSVYEHEEMHLTDKIKPYASAHTQKGGVDEATGMDSEPEVDNEHTEKTETTDSNNNPKPSKE